MSNARSRPVELVSDSDLWFASEEDALLLVRLRAATILLSASFVSVLVRDITFREGQAWQSQAAATVAMMLSAALLGSERGLKAAEAAAFGLAAGVVAVRLSPLSGKR